MLCLDQNAARLKLRSADACLISHNCDHLGSVQQPYEQMDW